MRITLALLATVVTLSTASLALADGGRKDRHAAKAKNEKKPHKPMKAAKFHELVERKLQRAEQRMEHALKKRNVPAGTAAAIRSDFASAAAQVRQAAASAEADGTVTPAEAKAVRELAAKLKRELFAKYGAAQS
jgi:tellurite resistance protein